jgi:hypothetical protein
MKLFLAAVLLITSGVYAAAQTDPMLDGLPIHNPGDLVIGADRDNIDPSKYISVKVGGTEAVAVGRVTETMGISNLRGIGIGTSQIKALLHFGGTDVLGFSEIMRVETNEEGTAPFGWTLAKYAGNAGETKQDNQFCWGYNVGPGGNKIVPSEHSYGHCIENRYRTNNGVAQLEEYNFFIPGNECVGTGCVTQRTMSVSPELASGLVINRFEGLHVMKAGATQQMLDKDLSFYNGTGAINYHGNRTSNALMLAGGTPILSFKFNTGNKVELFNTGVGNAEVGLFATSASTSVLSLTFAGQRDVLNPNAAGFRKNGTQGMEVNHGSGWAKILSTESPCETISASVGGADDMRAINAILACLRSKGLVAQ